MEQSHTVKKGLLVLLAGGMLMSTTSTQAITAKGVALCTPIIFILGRLAWKDAPGEGKLELKDALGKLKEQLDKPFSKEMLQLLWAITDDVFIGFKGKVRGFKVMGSKVIFEEGEKKVIGTRSLPDGELLELYRYDNQWPYGLCGWLWAYAKAVSSELKSLDDLYQMTQEKHIYREFLS